jgi:hypothetical protein
MGQFTTGAGSQQVRPCPLCPDSDQILQRSEMTRWARLRHCSAILSAPTRVDGGLTRADTRRFASMAFQEMQCGLAKGPRRLQTKGMRGVGKDDLLHVREIAR